MRTLADLVTYRLETMGWQQKQLAHEWHRCAGGTGKVSTFETRLSKLLNGDEAGYRFALDEEGNKLGSLATALGVDEVELRLVIERSRDRLVLVLSPLLDAAITTFFEKRAVLSDGAFECDVLDKPCDRSLIRERLRDLGMRRRNAVVVVPHDRDHDFFEGAGVRTTRVVPTGPWFSLMALPDLTAPRPPRLHDTDGMPMVPAPSVEKGNRELMTRQSERHHVHEHQLRQAERWIARIREADAEGTPVTFRLDWLEATPSSEDLKRETLNRATETLVSDSARSDRPKRAVHIWVHDGHILALGPEDDPRRLRVQELHQVHAVTSLEPLVTAVRVVCAGLNPWREGGEFDFSAELQAVKEETGIAVVLDGGDLRGCLKPLRSSSSRGDEAKEITATRSSEHDARARALLDDLLGRDFILPMSKASVIFQLVTVRDAPLVWLKGGAGIAVLANVGAGRLLRVNIIEYRSETPAPVRYNNGGTGDVLDAGDLRIEILAEFDKYLEGTVIGSLRRRREEEPRKWDDD